MTLTTRQHTLANGVRLLFDPAPAYESVAISAVAGRGARFEDAEHCGWSHLLEHMVFKGAGRRSASQLVEEIEGEGGQINAATGYERTSFQARTLPEGVDRALEILADLILAPHLHASDLEREKHIVAQEIAEAFDTPDDQVFEMAQAAAFPGQPLGRPILGEATTLASATPAALEDWRRRLYSADRLVVSVAGKADEDATMRRIDALFGGATAIAGIEAQPGSFIGGVVTDARRLEQSHLVLLLPGPALEEEQYWAHRLFTEILGGGMASRLFQEVRERLGLAYAVDAFAESWSDVGVLGVYAGCAAEDVGRLGEAVGREIRHLACGLKAEDLARAKAQLKAGLLMSRESLASRAEQSAVELLSFGSVRGAARHLRDIDAVSVEDIQNLHTRHLADRRFAAATLGPKGAAAAAPRVKAALFD